MTNCPNCGYPTSSKGIYTTGKPCDLCGITTVVTDANTCTMTMPTFEMAMQNAALAASRLRTVDVAAQDAAFLRSLGIKA